jgi:hypothetical protein
MTFFRPFASAPHYAFAADGLIYYTPGDGYRIDVLGHDGASVAQVRSEVPLAPVTDADYAQWLKARELDAAADPNTPSTWLVQLRGIQRATTRATLGRVVAGPGSSLLVERLDKGPIGRMPYSPPASLAKFGATSWDLIDHRGILGTVAMPAGFAPSAFTLHWIVGITYDDDGVQWVDKYSLEGAL